MKQNQLHVVYIITKLELGGAQKVCLSLFNGMTQNNLHAMLISGPKGELASSIRTHKNVYFINEFIREISVKSFINECICFYKLYTTLRRLKKKYPHLIVHTHSTKAGMLGRWAAWLAGISVRMHTIHGFAFHKHQTRFVRNTIRILEWLTSFITTHFICVSSEDVKTGLATLHRFSEKHSIIRAAVETEQFYIPARRCVDFPNETKLFIFGTISCFKKQKNLTDLLYAFAYVHQHNPHTRLEIIGDGMLRDEITALIKTLHLTHAVTCHGWQQTVAPYMLNWHAFVLTSLWEGLPCAAVEARLLKLPVLSYRTGGIHDIITHEQNGLLFKQKDWQGLANGMLNLSQNRDTHAKLSSCKENLSDFTHETMIAQHIDLYRSLFEPS